MRHRAPRPLVDLRYRVPRAAARLLGEAARPGAVRTLVAVMVALSLGTAAYAALGSMTGGSSDRQAESAGATASGDGEGPQQSGAGGSQQESGDGGRPTSTGASPTPAVRTPGASRSESGKAAARQRAARSANASTAPGDVTPPRTSLSEEFPARDAARFSFSANESASFSCSLDGAAYAPCGSPTSYSDLAPGWHTFAVRATDAAGNVDPSPAQTRWHAKDGRSTGQ